MRKAKFGLLSLFLFLIAMVVFWLWNVDLALAEAKKASSLGWTYARATTSTTNPEHFCEEKEFYVFANSHAECVSPEGGGQALAEADASIGWGGRVRIEASETGSAGGAAHGTAIGAIEAQGNLLDNVLTVTVDGSVTKEEPLEEARIQFMCYLLSVPQDVNEAEQVPSPGDVLASGVLVLPRGSFSPIVSGAFEGLVSALPNGARVSGTIVCALPEGTDPENAVVSLEAAGAGAVGGTTEILVDSSAAPASMAEGSGSSALPYAVIGGVAAAAAVAIAAGGWYARRRLS